MEIRDKKHDEQCENLEIARKIDKDIEKFIGEIYSEDIETEILNIIKKYDCKLIEKSSRKASHTRNMIDKYFSFTKNGNSTNVYITYLVSLTNDIVEETKYSCYY